MVFLTFALQQGIKADLSVFKQPPSCLENRTPNMEQSKIAMEIHFGVTCLIDKIIQMLCLPARELCTKIITPL